MYLDGLDELDQKIVRLLIENARVSYSDLGEKIGLSRVAVKARIQALEQRGIIEEYTTVINPQKISGAVSCYFEIETTPGSLPEVIDIETAFNCILHAQGKRDMYVKFDLSGLQRGTFAERQEGYRTSVLGGWKTLNDVRRDEDEEPLPGLDVTLRPLSYATVDADGTVHAADTSAGARSALDPEGGDHIIKDMRRRVRERFENKGDVEASRAFARRVFEPYALACEEAGVPFDLEGEVAACATSTSTRWSWPSVPSC